jgi:hypothetical protein
MPALVAGLNKAEITYRVNIYVTTPGKMYGTNVKCVHSVELDVVAAPPTLTAPPRVEDNSKVMRCYCIPAGTMQLAAMSSLSAFKAGDHPVVSYEVNNQSSQDVSYVDISVERRISWSAQGHHHSSNKTIVTARVAGVAQGDGFGFNGATVWPETDNATSVQVENGARFVTLQVPDLAFFTTMTPSINVVYSIKIKAKTESSFVRDPEVLLPIFTYRLGLANAGGETEKVDDDGGGGDDDDDGAEVFIATVVGIEYAPNPDFFVQVIETPIEATLVT